MVVTQQRKLKDATFKYIESELFAYKDTLKEIEKLRVEIMYGKDQTDENTGGGKSNIPGRPTERIATRLVTNKKLERMEKVTNAIAKVYSGLNSDCQKLVNLKYWTKRQTLSWQGIVDELHVSRKTAFNWKKLIIQAIADELGER